MLKGKKIYLLMPALNEEENIGRVLESIPKYIDKVFVVNDGSTDNTKAIAESYGATVISHSTPRGVGVAFNSGVTHILNYEFDILVNMDSDGQFNSNDIAELVNPLVIEEADFATASRFKDKTLYPVMPKSKFYGNLFMARFISVLTGTRFYDVSCGFRAYSRDTLLRMNLFGQFTYTQESFLDLAFKGLRMAEIPATVRGTREFGKSRVASNLFRYGYQTFKIIIRSYRDYKPMQLFFFLALFPFLIGIGMLTYLGIHYLEVGSFSPYKYVGFSGGFLVLLSAILISTGFILDMFSRMRMNQEKLLYQLKKANNGVIQAT